MYQSNDIRLAEEKISRFQECFQEIKSGMEQVLIGQEAVVRQMAVGVLSGGHMLLIGVPGLAKTLMSKTMADTLGWSFRRIQFTPDLMPSDITGTEILQSDEGGSRRELVFHKGPIFANLILADEINRTPPKTQAALLEAMQEHAVTVNGKTYACSPPFVVIATQNPIEQEGTYPLPEAQLDRFMLNIKVGYPDREAELKIAGRPSAPARVNSPLSLDLEAFLGLMNLVDQVPITPPVLSYAVSLTTQSRPQDPAADDFTRQYVSWGAGPRATQHLVKAAKTVALMDGRPSPEVRDVKEMAAAVLRHRILPNYNALGEGIDSEAIIAHLLETVK